MRIIFKTLNISNFIAQKIWFSRLFFVFLHMINSNRDHESDRIQQTLPQRGGLQGASEGLA